MPTTVSNRNPIPAIGSLALSMIVGVSLLTGCQKPPAPRALTIAFTASSHEPAPALKDEVVDLITDHARKALLPVDASIKVITQGRPAFEVDLTPMRGKEVEADPAKADQLIADHVTKLIKTVSSQTAATDGLDTLGVLDQALQITPAGGTIVLITSGISTVAPVSLPDAGDWMMQPAKFVDLIDPPVLPDASGRHLIFTGLGYGDPDGHQPSAGTSARSALNTIWTHICAATGAASCTIEPGPAGFTAPIATNTVPVVAFDQVNTHCVGNISISADIAFAPGSATLTSAVDAQLSSLATTLRGCPPQRVVNAYGHAAEVPGGGDGIELSRRRAQAILDRLLRLGAPRDVLGAAIGYGNTSHQIIDNTPGGVYIETLAKLNRTVELTIGSKQ